MILLNNKIESLPQFTSAQKLLEDKFILEFTSNNNKTNKTNKIKKRIELNLGDIACFVKPNAVNPIRIFPILMSITLHHYKIFFFKAFM